jgi:hypothetical protein
VRNRQIITPALIERALEQLDQHPDFRAVATLLRSFVQDAPEYRARFRFLTEKATRVEDFIEHRNVVKVLEWVDSNGDERAVTLVGREETWEELVDQAIALDIETDLEAEVAS